MHEHCNHCHNTHTNAFLDLNGVPYLLAEYLDRNTFQQLDRSLVRSEITVDQTEAMRAIIDLNINDIGIRASTGLPAIVGNNTKQKNLLKMIEMHADHLDHQLDVIRRGIIMRVNYQVENIQTGHVMRTMCEDLRINDRSYFLDINPRDVSDNAIIVNFNDTLVSTVNEFTHGRDRMMFRITKIEMFYECLRRDRYVRGHDHCGFDHPVPTCYGDEIDYYKHHYDHQHHQCIDRDGYHFSDYGNEDISRIAPPKWSLFNRFYRFDNGGRDVVLHGQEINDPMARGGLIPCGTVNVNRTFMINPGHKIVFRFSVWKNDLTVVSDTTRIAQELKAPLMDTYYGGDDHTCGCDHDINPDTETILRMLKASKENDNRQNYAINQLVKIVEDLQDRINYGIPGATKPTDKDDTADIHVQIANKLADVQTSLDAIRTVHTVPLSISDKIQNIMDYVGAVRDEVRLTCDCGGKLDPDDVTDPTTPTDPTEPSNPTDPTTPDTPTTPTDPVTSPEDKGDKTDPETPPVVPDTPKEDPPKASDTSTETTDTSTTGE